jgi:hypothetical protein
MTLEEEIVREVLRFALSKYGTFWQLVVSGMKISDSKLVRWQSRVEVDFAISDRGGILTQTGVAMSDAESMARGRPSNEDLEVAVRGSLKKLHWKRCWPMASSTRGANGAHL